MGFPALPSGMRTEEIAAQLRKEKPDTDFAYSQGEMPEHWEKLCFILTTKNNLEVEKKMNEKIGI